RGTGSLRLLLSRESPLGESRSATGSVKGRHAQVAPFAMRTSGSRVICTWSSHPAATNPHKHAAAISDIFTLGKCQDAISISSKRSNLYRLFNTMAFG